MIFAVTVFIVFSITATYTLLGTIVCLHHGITKNDAEYIYSFYIWAVLTVVFVLIDGAIAQHIWGT